MRCISLERPQPVAGSMSSPRRNLRTMWARGMTFIRLACDVEESRRADKAMSCSEGVCGDPIVDSRPALAGDYRGAEIWGVGG